jgi:peptide/nickel transport system substrate-binding protein
MRETEPQRGGTLTMVGAGDVDHLDPALAYHTVTRGILRAYTRQLVGYAAGRDRDAAGRIVADLATEVPTEANGRVAAGGTRFRFTLRDGVCWDAPSGARPVTAADVVRGIKRLADPRAPSPGLPYYLTTIEGLAEFRDALAASPAGAIAERLERTAVSGVFATGEAEICFVTRYPTPDFLNMLALPFATPAPAEYLAFAPGSPALDRALIACGPYRIRDRVPGETIVLDRNPAWAPESDPLRAAHIDHIVVREQISEPRAHDLVATGAADMLWDIQPLTAELPALLRARDPRLEVYPAGLLSPYLVVNFAAARSPVQHRDVRLALHYALDKAAVSAVWGGRELNDIADQLLPPLCFAHREHRPFRTAESRGDPDRARELLAAAGFPAGVRLRLVFRDRDIHPETAEVVRDALARAGIDVELVPASINKLFSGYFAAAVSSTSASEKDNAWDIALTGWEPDWYGNNARTYLQPLLDSRDVPADGDWGSNFGHYRDDRVNRLLESALTCADEARADELFREAEAAALADGAVVPILFAHQYWFHAPRVRNWLPYPVLNGDLTNLWLAPAPAPGERGVQPA